MKQEILNVTVIYWEPVLKQYAIKIEIEMRFNISIYFSLYLDAKHVTKHYVECALLIVILVMLIQKCI